MRDAISEQEADGNTWFARRVYPSDLTQLIENYPDMPSVWINAVMTETEDSVRRINNNSPFYSGLCIALLETDTAVATRLYWRLQEAGPFAHVTDKNTGIELLDFDLFRATPNSNLTSTWTRKLEECATDQQLMRIAFLAQYGRGYDWLWSYIVDGLSSSVPIKKARAITLLGFFDTENSFDTLEQLAQSLPDTWFKDLAQLSIRRWKRNAWAKYWFRQFLIEVDDVLAWTSFRLFLQCVTSQFWHWLKEFRPAIGEENTKTSRWTFFKDNFEVLRHSVEDNEKELAKQFLGQKVLERELWPWMSFS
jgi:hypothetical protein